jgi:NAD-dependent dihydropyrimidine dehydrogenase PreA subunit
VGTCSGSCNSYACFKGGPADGEGLATAGCPLGTHPAHLSDNRNCVLCLTCAQACPHRSVQLRLRAPAADLQREMRPPEGETGLILVLAGGLVLHHWVRPLGGLRALWPESFPTSLQEGPLLPRLAIACLALALPAAAFLGLRLLLPRARLLLYGLLPLLWALMLAHTLPVGMGEGGQVLSVSLAALPGWSADPHVVAFCQSVVCGVGVIGSAVLLRRLLQLNAAASLLLSALALGIGVAGRVLVAA